MYTNRIYTHRFRAAFTLVELSIVLVILGLLVGGVLTGQSLIRASELRTITTQHANLTAAVYSFRDKYFQFPGDMNNATTFWGTNAGCVAATAGTGTQTCNGNGDGFVSAADPGGVQEAWYIWQHLANAGLLEGSYSGVSPVNYYDCDATRCPRGKLSNTYWYVTTWGVMGGTDGFPWNDSTRSLFIFGADQGGYTGAPTLTPEEAWNVDTKIDDGRPAIGRWMNMGNGYNGGCMIVTATGVAAVNADYTKANASNLSYNLANKTKLCGFVVWWQ